MVDFDRVCEVIGRGLKEYVGCELAKTNQDKKPPAYPYLSYTVTIPASANKGTYGEYDDGAARKPIYQTWSITSLSKNTAESVTNAIKAREWLDRVGKLYLDDHGIIVQSVGNITNRDNFLTSGYEYRNGFDAVFTLFDTVDAVDDTTDEVIDEFELNA